jgi:CRISPR-associated protein (TIGR03986 family)
MAEIFEGTLTFKGEGKDRRRFLSYTSKKGKPMSEMVNPEKLTASLREQQETEIQVSFELEPSGRPFRVRAAGEEWKEIAAPPVSSRQGRTTSESDRRYDRGRDDRRYGSGRDYQSARSDRPRPPGDFHNPYNFVPALPRPKTGTDLDDAGDDKLAGHDRYHDDRWSGRIAVKLTTRTPLIILDTARVTIGSKDHKTFPTRIDADGNPYLAPTSIKGMLHAAYEAATNSRMGVFEKHQDRLAYRMPAKIGPVPARVERRGEGLGLRIMQAAVMGFAAKLPRYEDDRRLPRDKGESSAALPFPDRSLPVHGEAVWVQVDRSRCDRIERRTTPDHPSGNWQPGWVCVTGPNINRKRYERVFLEGPTDPFIPITSRHENLWRELIQNYQETHTRDLQKRKNARGGPIPPQAYLGDKPGETGWSRHVYEESSRELNEGTLCYVEFAENSNDEVTALIPVTISRRLYAVSPDPLLSDTLKPATRFEQLSPADRVFGWVNQKGAGAYRGNLRVGVVTCSSPDPILNLSKVGVPLAILGQPKPQQARFYVAGSAQGEAQGNGTSREQSGYWPHKGLRGRKVYPHHANLPETYWENPDQDRTQQSDAGFFQEYRRPHASVIEAGSAKLDQSRIGFELKMGDDSEQRDDQNRSVTSWVKRNAEFEFEIIVTNLSRVELGALIWILELPTDHCHRLGGGKPLGFGSVSLAIDWDRTDLRDGQAVRQRYCTLDEISNRDPKAAQACTEDFKRAVAHSYGSGDFERASFIAAFRSYAKGFTKPVHYPRALQRGQHRTGTIPPHPEGKAFEWFVANERTGRDGGPKLALLDLASDEGLPVLDAK